VPPFRYPITLDVTGRRCVVIGGAEVALAKARDLLAAGAAVTIVASDLREELLAWGKQDPITIIRRDYRAGDLEGAFLAVAATGDRELNRRIFAEANERGVLMNAVDDVDNCHFAAPSILRRGDLMIAFSTSGKAPALARQLRRKLSDEFGPEWGALVDLLSQVREQVLPRRTVDFATWAGRWERALELDLIGMIAAGEIDRAREAVRRTLEGEDASEPAAAAATGKVYIVGAGPGDPGLITVRGKQLVDAADIVVYDRLVNPVLVEGKDSICVGKQPGGRCDVQPGINHLLIRLARRGNAVVRLKGGDPFVFGRGAEEAEALAEAGVEFEVVPAPSSAFAAPAYAGIPVTDRRWSSSVAVVTGHCVDGRVDWARLAGAVDTIVILMGLAHLKEIVEALIFAGAKPDTPAAIVENGTLPNQRVVAGDLASLPELALENNVQSPAIVIVGENVREGDRIAWFGAGRPAPATPQPGPVTPASSAQPVSATTASTAQPRPATPQPGPVTPASSARPVPGATPPQPVPGTPASSARPSPGATPPQPFPTAPVTR
jgi:uroporphyrin-III C-methyltransferase / precorrin-2 dehydrogenase / sirohydrochlorin ferrochelatase